MTVVPIAQLSGSRMPEQGRIRTGIYNGEYPQAIDTFRFTSSDESAIEEIANLYGGTARPWVKQKGKFEVITDTNELRVVLPVDSTSIGYELWGGQIRQRMCNGDEASVLDSEEMVDCMCRAAGVMKCDPKTRIRVILPDIRFGGTWRYESSSWNVFHELNTMADFIELLNANTGGSIEATMRLEPRSSMGTNAKTGKPEKRNYNIVVLGINHSTDQLLSGQAAYAGPLAVDQAPGQAAIEARSAPKEVETGDTAPDDVVDAEIVQEDEQDAGPWASKKDIPAGVGATYNKGTKTWHRS